MKTAHPYPWCNQIDQDAFGELDLSGSGGKSGAIGCMVSRLDDLNKQECQLITEIESIRAARAIALAALDQFVAQDHHAPAQADNH